MKRLLLFIPIIFTFIGCASSSKFKEIFVLDSYQTNLSEKDVVSVFKNKANQYLSQAK